MKFLLVFLGPVMMLCRRISYFLKRCMLKYLEATSFQLDQQKKYLCKLTHAEIRQTG